jgi:hypothetical protein
MIKVLDKPHLDLTTAIGRGFIAFLSALAEDERQRIVNRANEGRAAARKRGVHMGRKPKLTDLQRRVARERVAKGESARAIANGAWLTPPLRGPSRRRILDRILAVGVIAAALRPGKVKLIHYATFAFSPWQRAKHERGMMPCLLSSKLGCSKGTAI